MQGATIKMSTPVLLIRGLS